MSIDFSQVKLKKVAKQEATTTTVPSICNSAEEYDKLLKEASFENYYDYIKDYSFRSFVFTLDIQTIKALVEENEKFVEFQKQGTAGDYLGWKQRKELLALASEIEKTGSELYGSEEAFKQRGVFVRLSTLSPKDAACNRESFVTETKKCLETIREMEKLFIAKWGEEKGSFGTEDNRKLCAIYTSAITTLRLYDGNYAVQLFIESGRAQQEFKVEIEKADAAATRGEQFVSEYGVVVREWANFEVSAEFRAFVYNKKLTAITQYNPQVYFPQLVSFKEQITNIVAEFTRKLVEGEKGLPLKNAVLDIILCPKQPLLEYLKTHNEWHVEELFEVKIVELNPFAEFTGTCLFEWFKNWDILSGKAPFEFRIVEQVPKYVIQNLSKQWMPAYKQL